MEKSELIEFAIKKYSKEIRLIANKYYLSGGSNEDLFQEGLIGVIQGVQNYDFGYGDENSDSFKKFVLMCAKRQILDAIKKSNRKKNEPLNSYVAFDKTLDSIGINGEALKFQSGPEDVFIQNESLKERNDNIKLLLSKNEKEVLDLYLDGKRQSEIANILNKSTKSVDNTLQRVKNKLKGNNK